MAEAVVFFVCTTICMVGALGVILARHPVHSALMLVMTLFGVAVLFIAQEAYFLAAVQVIVYAGAIVVLFLFVIMLVGVDQAEDVRTDPIIGQRAVAAFIGGVTIALAVLVGVVVSGDVTGQRGRIPIGPGGDPVVIGDDGNASFAAVAPEENIRQLGRTLFTDYVLAVEITAILLTIAVVGAVVLAKRPKGELEPLPDAEASWLLRPEPEPDALPSADKVTAEAPMAEPVVAAKGEGATG